MGINKREEGKKVNSNINVTPMVDVMLVLLIIFMVITPMLNNKVNGPAEGRRRGRWKTQTRKTLCGRGDAGWQNVSWRDQVTLDDLGPKISAKLENKTQQRSLHAGRSWANYGK
jgi:biopolymer transport protein ExbD/biopolymer transport protein TolR